jgi:glycosyltransferase involved in cell wall biosynthesis
LEAPDVDALASAAAEVLDDPARFHKGARERAEAAFDLEMMVDAYLDVFMGGGFE